MKLIGKISGITVMLLLLVQLPASAAEWEHYIHIPRFNAVVNHDGEFWCATWDGLFVFNADESSSRRIPTPSGAVALLWENDESLIVSTEVMTDAVAGAGIYRYNQPIGSWSKLNTPDENLLIMDMAQDGDGNIWCAGYAGYGLYVVKGDSIVAYAAKDDLSDYFSEIISLDVAPDGTAWMGYVMRAESNSWSGVAYYDGTAWVQELEMPNGIRDLKVSPDGTVWIYNYQTSTIYQYNNKALTEFESDSVNDFFGHLDVTASDDIWWSGDSQIARISNGVIESMTNGLIDALEQEQQITRKYFF